MSDRFLLHKPSGVVHIWQGVWANHPDFEEVADTKGTPLKAAIDADFEVVDEAPKKKPRAKKVVEESADEPDLDTLLSIEAARGL